jgi:rhamnose utilization protein RhaD (predicted bifunctional aldolase and dehydrogenase)
MRNRWDENEAARAGDDLEACVYVSRLLGAETALVLYGGGNTSVKLNAQSGPVLYVKGSGSDLAQVQARDFTPVRLDAVRRLIDTAELSNDELAQAVVRHVIGESAPRPSIETLLHACLPHRFVLHTHADSILALCNCEHGERIAGEVFGKLAPRVPFRESGFELAKAAHEVYRANATEHSIGLILLHHGVFSFADSAREAYDNMLTLVGLAETYLAAHAAWRLPVSDVAEKWSNEEISALRCAMSVAAGFPLVMHLLDTPEARAFARNAQAVAWWDEGPATPQHAVFVKRKPLFGRDVAHYVDEYRNEVSRQRPGAQLSILGLDPAPRVVVDPHLGVWTASINAHHARMTAEIFSHDVEIISRAARHDRYAGLPGSAILDAEIAYGGFERKARARYPVQECLLGEVALVACSVGTDAIAAALARRGADVACTHQAEHATLHLQGNDTAQAYLRSLVREVGGLDVLVLDPACESWLQECLPLLRNAPQAGRVVLVGPRGWAQETRNRLTSADNLKVSAIDPAQLRPEVLAEEVARNAVPTRRLEPAA